MAHRMVHFAEKAHLDRDALARLNSAVVFGLIGTGLAVCAFGPLPSTSPTCSVAPGKADSLKCPTGLKRRCNPEKPIPQPAPGRDENP